MKSAKFLFWGLMLLIIFILVNTIPTKANIIDQNSKAKSTCKQLIVGGYPEPLTLFQETVTTDLCNISYFVSYNNICKVAWYSLERPQPENMTGNEPRVEFREDPRIEPQFRSKPQDYTNSGFDRGHLAPAQNFANDSVSMQQSFYMSNIIPQHPIHNRKYWKALEERTRNLVKNTGEKIVITGPIFTKPGGADVIRNDVCIPTALFKIILDPRTKQYVAIISENKDLDNHISLSDSVDLSVIDHLTSHRFFPHIDRNQLRNELGTQLFSRR